MNMICKRNYVLIVDSDFAMRGVIQDYFEVHNVPSVSISGQPELACHLAGTQPGLIILELRLEQDDGLDLLREIRSDSDVPVIIVTQHLRSEIDRVVGLELGADDYLMRPVSPRELLARVRAFLRRQEIWRGAREHNSEGGGYRFEGWQLERDARRLLGPDGTPVPLTKSEYALLLAFLKAPGRPLTREYLLHATRMNEDIFDRSIDVQVLRLRRKLEIATNAPQVIRTERGVGYVFALPVDRF